MGSLFQQAPRWLLENKFFGSLFILLSVLGVANVFLFAYRVGIPVSMRPLMDDNFSRQLSVDFFSAMAFCGISSKVITQFVIYNCRNPRILMRLLPHQSFFQATLNVLNNRRGRTTRSKREWERVMIVEVKQFARMLKRWEFVFTPLVSLVLFAFVFLHEGWWGFLICSCLVAICLWHVVGRVELRRAFASFHNTSSLDRERVLKAVIVFSVLFVCCEAFLAGYFKFRSLLLDPVMVDLQECVEEGAIVAVTANGILLASPNGDRFYEGFFDTPKIVFVPFNATEYVLLPIALNDGSCREIGPFPG